MSRNDEILESLGELGSSVTPCKGVGCGYCPDPETRFKTKACITHEISDALAEVVAHMVTEHWDEMNTVRKLALGDTADPVSNRL